MVWAAAPLPPPATGARWGIASALINRLTCDAYLLSAPAYTTDQKGLTHTCNTILKVQGSVYWPYRCEYMQHALQSECYQTIRPYAAAIRSPGRRGERRKKTNKQTVERSRNSASFFPPQASQAESDRWPLPLQRTISSLLGLPTRFAYCSLITLWVESRQWECLLIAGVHAKACSINQESMSR